MENLNSEDIELQRTIAKKCMAEGDYADAACAWTIVQKNTRDEEGRLQARRQAALCGFYALLCNCETELEYAPPGDIAKFIDDALGELENAWGELIQAMPTLQNEIQTRVDRLTVAWYMGHHKETVEGAEALLSEIGKKIAYDASLQSEFGITCKILRAAYASEEHRTEAYGEAITLCFKPGLPAEYRAQARLACAMICVEKGESETALKLCHHIIRMDDYHGPAKAVAWDVVEDILLNFDPI